MLALLLFILTMLVSLMSTGFARAQPVESPAPQDGSIWSRVTFGATFEGYYQYNWNQPYDRVIPLRAYDTRSNSFSIQQAALVVDAPPDRRERTPRAACASICSSARPRRRCRAAPRTSRGPMSTGMSGRPTAATSFRSAAGSRSIFGKFASNLGYETNYAKDNFNFSRAYLFNFLPYYHIGLRTSLPVSDKVTLMYMLTNGIQQTEDFNNFKSNHVSAVVKPGAAVHLDHQLLRRPGTAGRRRAERAGWLVPRVRHQRHRRR